jgi:hypothetical protein
MTSGYLLPLNWVALDACTEDGGEMLALLASSRIHQDAVLSFRIQTNQVHRTLLHHCIMKPGSRGLEEIANLAQLLHACRKSDSCPRCLE